MFKRSGSDRHRNMFRSSDFIFRPTTMSYAFEKAGISHPQRMIREARMESSKTGTIHVPAPLVA